QVPALVAIVPGDRPRSRPGGASRPAGSFRRSGPGRRYESPRPSAPTPARSASAISSPRRPTARRPSSARRGRFPPVPPQAARTRARSPRAGRRGPCPRGRAGSCAAARRRRSAGPRARRACCAGRAAGCAGARAARGPQPRPRPAAAAARVPAPAASPRAPRRTALARTRGRRRSVVPPLEHGEVELADRLFDQSLVVGVVERLARHLLRGDQAQVGDLGADLLQCAARFGLDLLARVLEPPLAVGLGLVAPPADVRLGDAPRFREDLLRLALGLADQLAVLLEQAERLV